MNSKDIKVFRYRSQFTYQREKIIIPAEAERFLKQIEGKSQFTYQREKIIMRRL